MVTPTKSSLARFSGHLRVIPLLVIGAAAAASCSSTGNDLAGSAPTPTAAVPLARPTLLHFPTDDPSTAIPAAGELLTLRGWLSIVWNDQPHFFLTDDSGQTVEVLLDEQLTTPFGGPLALDRSRVVVQAVVTQQTPTLFQALSIESETEG